MQVITRLSGQNRRQFLQAAAASTLVLSGTAQAADAGANALGPMPGFTVDKSACCGKGCRGRRRRMGEGEGGRRELEVRESGSRGGLSA